MGMLFNAHRGGVPLVVTAGQIDSRILLHDPHLSGQTVKMVSPLTKWSAEVMYVADIPVLIQRAFKMAIQPPTGPVFISLPQDVLGQSFDFEYKPGTPLQTMLRPDRDAINHAAELLVKAKAPAIIVENGVARNDALHEVVRLAELVGARVYQQWMSDVNFPVHHPLYLGEIRTSAPQSREILARFDVILVIGCQLFGNERYLPEPVIARDTKVIQIDDNPWEIAKNFPVDVGIQGNIKVSVAELIELLEQNMPVKSKEAAKNRAKAITKEASEIKATFMKQVEAERDKIPISVSRLMTELRDALKPCTLVVDDCWSSSVTLRRILNLNEPKSFQRSRCGGSIGWGMPGAIGARLAAPDHPVVSVVGDGSAMWSIQSLWTAAHYNIPVTFIVIANSSYKMVKHFWTSLLGGSPEDRHLGLELDSPVIDFCQLSRSLGVQAQKVKHPDELKKALKTALESDKPNLLEVCV